MLYTPTAAAASQFGNGSVTAAAGVADKAERPTTAANERPAALFFIMFPPMEHLTAGRCDLPDKPRLTLCFYRIGGAGRKSFVPDFSPDRGVILPSRRAKGPAPALLPAPTGRLPCPPGFSLPDRIRWHGLENWNRQPAHQLRLAPNLRATSRRGQTAATFPRPWHPGPNETEHLSVPVLPRSRPVIAWRWLPPWSRSVSCHLPVKDSRRSCPATLPVTGMPASLSTGTCGSSRNLEGFRATRRLGGRLGGMYPLGSLSKTTGTGRSGQEEVAWLLDARSCRTPLLQPSLNSLAGTSSATSTADGAVAGGRGLIRSAAGGPTARPLACRLQGDRPVQRQGFLVRPAFSALHKLSDGGEALKNSRTCPAPFPPPAVSVEAEPMKEER
ncbi:hypothetical protein QFZ23_001931 [Arthrobacter globiformis]|nr:hypothetical protein [Arthrobacter globiformis]